MKIKMKVYTLEKIDNKWVDTGYIYIDRYTDLPTSNDRFFYTTERDLKDDILKGFNPFK